MDKELLNEINAAYYNLEIKHDKIAHALLHRRFQSRSGWYSGQYHKGDNGNWIISSYPIPVIGIKGLCDIEIYFDKISVSTKMQRDTVLSYSFEKLSGYEMRAYGAKDHFADFYHTGQTIPEMKDRICACGEKEIGFSFLFPFDIDEKQIFEFAKLLRREGFYD